jgi:single-stranded-DNA-specific exonuclease
VASRLKDRFHRPTIVFARGNDGELRGSGRAIPGFHLRDALDLVAKRAPETITRFGGHAYAAGLSLPEPALPRFRAEFERVAREWLSPAALLQTLETDGELDAAELTLGLAQQIAAQVWGQGFPAPVFEGEFAVLEQRLVADKHLRLTLRGAGRACAAIRFNECGPLPERIHAAYRMDVNHYQGLSSLQLVLERWQPV